MKVRELIEILRDIDLDFDVHVQIDEYSDEYLLNTVVEEEKRIILKSY